MDDTLQSQMLGNLVDYFSEGFWLDSMQAGEIDPVMNEVSMRHAAASIEGIPEAHINIARKAAAVAVASGIWRPESV